MYVCLYLIERDLLIHFVCISGYDEALGMTLTNECSASQFVDSSDPIRLLTDTTAINFREEDDVYKDHPDTTEEIVECLKDLKVCPRLKHDCVTGRSAMVWERGCGCEEKLKASEPRCCPGAGLISGKPTVEPVGWRCCKMPLSSLIHNHSPTPSPSVRGC